MQSNRQFPSSTISFFIVLSITDYLAFMFLNGNFLYNYPDPAIRIVIIKKSYLTDPDFRTAKKIDHELDELKLPSLTKAKEEFLRLWE